LVGRIERKLTSGAVIKATRRRRAERLAGGIHGRTQSLGEREREDFRICGARENREAINDEQPRKISKMDQEKGSHRGSERIHVNKMLRPVNAPGY